MTLQRDGDGTAKFIPPALGSGVDFTGASQTTSRIEAARGASMPAPQVWPIQGYEGLWGFRFDITDFPDGHNKWQSGYFEKVRGGLIAGDADTEYEDHAFNPLKMLENPNPDTTTDNRYTLHATHFNGWLVMATLDFTHSARINLYYEDPDTGEIQAAGYANNETDGSDTILGITPIVVPDGSGQPTPVLALQRFNKPIMLLKGPGLTTTAVPLGEMDVTATKVCYGMFQTGLDTADIVIRARGSDIRTFSTWALPAGEVYNSANWTEQETNLPGSGYGICMSALAGNTVSLYWDMPPRDAPWDSAIMPGGEGDSGGNQLNYRGHIWRSDLFGQNFEDVTHEFGLNETPFAAYVRGGIWASDSHGNCAWWNIRTTKPMAPFTNALPDSDIERLITGFWIKDEQDLYIQVEEVAVSGVSRNTITYKMKYNWTNDSWHIKSQRLDVGTTGLQCFVPTRGGLPSSQLTGNLISHIRNGSPGSWYHQWQPSTGINPYTKRKTDGATAGTGKPFEATVTLTTPEFTLAQLPPGEYLVGAIYGPPIDQMAEGGAGASVDIECGGKSATFTAAERSATRPYKIFPVHTNWVQSLQLTASATRATSGTDAANHAVQVLPIRVEGLFRSFDAGKRQGIPIPDDWSRE